MTKSERIRIINDTLQKYFANSANPRKVLAKDLMPLLIKAGAFTADNKGGLPLRKLLRELDGANMLSAIPYVLPERKDVNVNWYFTYTEYNQQDKSSEKIKSRADFEISSTKSDVSILKLEERVECFAPIVDSKSEILILGTMPGPESLRKNEYYANSRNSFWKIIAAIYNDGKEFDNYEDKLNCIHNNHLALWDVYSSCEREGALDSNIKRAIPNDINALLESHPSIKKVILNGREAENAFTINFPHEYVISSSAANAKSIGAKVSDWKAKLK